MKALHGGRSQEFQHQYHLGRNDTPNFEQGQPGRIDLARMFIEKMLVKDLTQRPLRIVELGCGSGDVTGPYAGEPYDYQIYNTPRGAINTSGIEVVGIDVVPQSAVSVRSRYPNVKVVIGSMAS